LTTGSLNFFAGGCAGRATTTGNNNIFMGGNRTGCSNTSGSNNIFLGSSAGRYNTTGQFNIFLGFDGGEANETGSNNIFIGRYAGKGGTANSCSISIGCRSLVSGNNQVFIDSATGNAACFSGSFSAWGNTSDCRDKTNIGELRQGKDFLAQLRPVKFEWDFRADNKKNTPSQGSEEAGFLAQEVQEVVEAHNAEYLHLVNSDNPEELGLYKANFVPVLVKAVQELTAENETLKSQVETLTSEIAAIKEHLGL
jgi:hypothetical protein